MPSTDSLRRSPSLAAPAPLDLLLLLALATLWGVSYTFIKVAVETIPPVTVAAARVAAAAALLLLVARCQGLSLPRDRRTWRTLLTQAFLNSILPFTLIAWGELHIDSGLAGVLNATPPIFVLLITFFWTSHEPVTVRKLIGVLCGIGGVILIIGTDVLAGLGTQAIAQIAVTLASVCYAMAAIYGHRLSHLPPLISAVGTLLCATVLLVPASLVLDRPWTLQPEARSIAALAALAALSTALALFIYFRLLRTLGSMGLASNSYLRAGISVLLGVVFLGETITPVMAAGLALIVGGVATIIGRPVRRT